MNKLPLLALLLLVSPLVLANGMSGEPAAPAGPAQAADDDMSDFDDEFDEEEEIQVCDPFEPVNRGIFWFNDKLYFYLMKPVARGYRVVPEPARVSVGNFFSNVATPGRLINAGLQGKFGDAGNELIRFVVNTTVGVLGLFDPAKKHMGIDKKDEDTGQTLGVWGFGPGCYLVLPILGPSNFRDGIGRIGDYYMDPWVYILDGGTKEYYAVKAFDIINFLSLDKDTYEGLKKDSLDPYLFIRDAYMQYREGKVGK